MSRRSIANAANLFIEIDPPALVLKREDVGGAVETLRMTLDDVVFLAQYIPQFLQALVAAREAEDGAGADRALGFFLPASKTRVDTDLDGSRVLVTITDSRGTQSRFALPPELAQGLSDTLAAGVKRLGK